MPLKFYILEDLLFILTKHSEKRDRKEKKFCLKLINSVRIIG